MRSIPLKYSPFHRELAKKYIKNLLANIPMVVVLLVFSVIMLQPHKFQVKKDVKKDAEVAHEIYKEMLLSDNNSGEIQFETLLVGEDGDSKISYTTSPGDTLLKIAKLFGTTTDAIQKANNLPDSNLLHVGQKLIISYDKSIIHTIKKDISVKQFAHNYQLNIKDLLTLNYLESEESLLESGQQVFVPLNKTEAEEKGLIEKKKFVMLNIASEKKNKEPSVLEKKGSAENLSGTQEPETLSLPKKQGDELSDEEIQQKVVSAEDTAKYLQELKQAEKQAEIARKKAEELKKQAEELKKQAQLKAEIDRKKAEEIATKKAEEARIAQIEADKKAELRKKAELKEQIKREADRANQKKQEQKRLSDIAASCSRKQCYHEGKCRSKPIHAVCAPSDPDNAWSCKKGFVDTGRSCITQEEQKKKRAIATSPKKKAGVLKQWYLNPYKYGYSNGRGGGHCTHYAGYYRSSKLGKETNWRGNAKYWYANARAAGWRVGQTPTVNSIIVMKYGSQGWNGYGHVGIVLRVDRKSRQVLIQDMNYVGRYIVSQHRVDLDSTRNPVIGFVYPD